MRSNDILRLFPVRVVACAFAAGLVLAAFGPAAIGFSAGAPKEPPAAPPRQVENPPPVMEREKKAEPEAAAPLGSEIERFCSNVAEPARDRRYALQAAELETLQKDIEIRMAKLEEKRAEYEAWLKRRDDFLALAEKGVVEIYAKMKPDAAAERMEELKVELAASILMKLDARKASTILNEMDAKIAAAVTGIIASAARKVDPS